MSYKYLGDAVMYASLTVEAPRPLDTRTVVDGIENLYDIPASSAYQGMTVANINDGNLYMLIDKNKIAEKAGWKASYESILIITCTQVEYDTWDKNTTEDYKPIDSTLPYLRRDVYYYIYEDEENSQYYVTKKQIEDWLSTKASSADLTNLSSAFESHTTKYNEDSLKITTSISEILTKFENYSTSELIEELYATKENLKLTDDKFANYYTSEQINNTLDLYVTKESLRGGLEGEDDFVFVTQNQYNSDKAANAINFTTQSLTLSKKLEGGEDIVLSINTTATDILVNNKPLAYKEEVPKILLVETKALYDEMEKDPETYYYICDDETIGYLTNTSALETFYTKVQVNDLIAAAKLDLIDKYIIPLQNEIAALKGSES